LRGSRGWRERGEGSDARGTSPGGMPRRIDGLIAEKQGIGGVPGWMPSWCERLPWVAGDGLCQGESGSGASLDAAVVAV
jgi:hypothetical protein